MRATVAGSMFLSNGHDTPLHMDATLSQHGISCHFKLLGGHFVCDLDGLKDTVTTDELIRWSRHFMDIVILSEVVMDRQGIGYTVEYCNIEGKGIITTEPDRAPVEPDLGFRDIQEVFDILGKHSEHLKYALRDYNEGLLDRENCPMLFYRCIETLALLVTGADDINDKTWAAFHAALGTDKSALATLLKFSKSHRHGTHVGFTVEEHRQMMRETHLFVLRTLYWLKNHARL